MFLLALGILFRPAGSASPPCAPVHSFVPGFRLRPAPSRQPIPPGSLRLPAPSPCDLKVAPAVRIGRLPLALGDVQRDRLAGAQPWVPCRTKDALQPRSDLVDPRDAADRQPIDIQSLVSERHPYPRVRERLPLRCERVRPPGPRSVVRRRAIASRLHPSGWPESSSFPFPSPFTYPFPSPYTIPSSRTWFPRRTAGNQRNRPGLPPESCRSLRQC